MIIRLVPLIAVACGFATASATFAAGVENKVQPFALDQVRLLDGPFKQAQELNGKYILSLDTDRLLRNFRVNAGLPATAEPLGGWESPGSEVRGHFVGHYLSACALMYKSTGDDAYKRRVDLLVAELARCQQALGGGYLSAFPPSFFDRLEAGKGVWAPYYTVHKIMAGLFDAYDLCGDKQALDVLNGMAAYFKGRIDKLSDEQMKVVMKTEFGGMPEVLANLYAVTGNPDHLALSKRFDDRAVLDPLAAREDKLAGLHANTQIPKVIGAARLYELTGDERFHTIADYFWPEVAEHRSFVTGSNSFAEHFAPLGIEATQLAPNTAESCNVYNMLKLTRHLFEWQPDAKYADYYERALFNHILGSIDPDSGMTMYYLALKPGCFKVYGTPLDSFWCCTGTGVENHAKYGDSIYFHDAGALWVNLFIPSELTWAEKGLKLRQETKFPEEQGTTLTVHVDKALKLALNLRVPYWATKGVAVKVNGEAQQVAATPESYLTIEREWNDGDKVELSLPMRLRLYHATDDAGSVAILYGPLVLAGEMGTERMPATQSPPRGELLFPDTAHPPAPALVTDNMKVDDWIKPTPDRALGFATVGVGRPNDVKLIPLCQLHHERYTVYWKLLSPADWEKRQKTEGVAKAEPGAIDDAGFGRAQAEWDRDLQGDRTGSGVFRDRPWRDAFGGGWFSESLKVKPDAPMALRCTYWGGDSGGREFDILVDGTKIGSETLENRKPGEFFTVDYAIPPELTRGKEKVTVRFQAQAKKIAGGVFACAIVPAAKTP